MTKDRLERAQAWLRYKNQRKVRRCVDREAVKRTNAAIRLERVREAEEIKQLQELNRKELTCQFCEIGITRLHKRTGELVPCDDCKRLRLILRKYDVSLRVYWQMWKSQNGQCAICAKDLVRGRGTHVDHCHELKHVRGLLCASCNFAIGAMRDDEMFLNNAANYLRFNRMGRHWWVQKNALPQAVAVQ